VEHPTGIALPPGGKIARPGLVTGGWGQKEEKPGQKRNTRPRPFGGDTERETKKNQKARGGPIDTSTIKTAKEAH